MHCYPIPLFLNQPCVTRGLSLQKYDSVSLGIFGAGLHSACRAATRRARHFLLLEREVSDHPGRNTEGHRSVDIYQFGRHEEYLGPTLPDMTTHRRIIALGAVAREDRVHRGLRSVVQRAAAMSTDTPAGLAMSRGYF